MKLYKLTKDQCPQCVQLTGFLSTSRMKDILSKVDVQELHLESDAGTELYDKLFQQAVDQGVKSFPILLDEAGQVLFSGRLLSPKKLIEAIEGAVK